MKMNLQRINTTKHMETQVLSETRGIQVGDFSRSAGTGPGEAGFEGREGALGLLLQVPRGWGSRRLETKSVSQPSSKSPLKPSWERP